MSTDFTPTQQAMVDILADGHPHAREELHACLPDDLGPLSNIWAHLSAIRKALRPKGQDIICQLHYGAICYRQVEMPISSVTPDKA